MRLDMKFSGGKIRRQTLAEADRIETREGGAVELFFLSAIGASYSVYLNREDIKMINSLSRHIPGDKL